MPVTLDRFEAAEFDPAGFHHDEHVRVAWLMLCAYPFDEARTRFSNGLRATAVKVGRPQLYHETVTVAYLKLVEHRMSLAPAADDWPAFAARNPDLLKWKPGVLDRLYSPDLLWSDRARAEYCQPDLAPLACMSQFAPTAQIISQEDSTPVDIDRHGS